MRRSLCALAAAALLAVSLSPGNAADLRRSHAYQQPVAAYPEPSPLSRIPVVGTVVSSSLMFAGTLIFAPFELLPRR
jgi:hypothetical protein